MKIARHLVERAQAAQQATVAPDLSAPGDDLSVADAQAATRPVGEE